MTSTTTTAAREHRAGRVPVAPAAVGAAGAYLAVAGVQVALAAGAPIGQHVWGGTQPRVLPTRMRVASGGSAVALAAMAFVVVRQGGLVGRPARWLAPATWAITACMAVNTMGNVASKSTVERFGFAPVTAVATGLTAVVARASQEARRADGAASSVVGLGRGEQGGR